MCDSFTIPTGGQSYQYVRGRLVGYQYGSPDAFQDATYQTRWGPSIDDYYVDGVSITHGQSPKKHIWTYAVGVNQYIKYSNQTPTCPGTGYGRAQPSFVGMNYFCDSGNPLLFGYSPEFYHETPLWSNIRGNCSECNNDDLYFGVKLSEATTDDIELRICTNEDTSNEDIRLELIDLYVK